jgi:transcriptional regulator of acetoin/glycerol metabolism
VDVRFVAATHRPLRELAESGEFRADLFARLNGFSHALPPLRARREDLGLLVGALLRRAPGGEAAQLTIEAGRALVAYAWPANVRELAQALSRALAVAPSPALDVHHLPDALAGVAPAAPEPTLDLSAADLRLREQLVDALRAHHGSVSGVARSMGKARMQIQRWLKRLKVDAQLFRED